MTGKKAPPSAKETPAPLQLLQPGDIAPEFKLPDQDNNIVGLQQFRGRKVVLFFYPRDLTPGCTKEACGFRDYLAEIQKTGAVILGVSVDTVRSHKKFADKERLPFPLLADTEKTMVESYRVWGSKKFMGRQYMGIHRVTYLINESGRIEHIWPSVKPEEHPAEVLEFLTTKSAG